MATESPSKLMKNTFYFTLKALCVLKIFKFLSWLFDHVEIRLDQKGKVNFKIYGVTAWLTDNDNTHIAQYWRINDNQTMKFGQLMECNMGKIFLKKIMQKMWWRNYSQTLFWKIKIEHISWSIVQSLLHDNLIAIEIDWN